MLCISDLVADFFLYVQTIAHGQDAERLPYLNCLSSIFFHSNVFPRTIWSAHRAPSCSLGAGVSI